MDESLPKHLIEVVLEGAEFDFRHVVDLPKGQGCSFLKVDLVVVGVVRGDFSGVPLREHIGEFVVLWGNYLPQDLFFSLLLQGNGVSP